MSDFENYLTGDSLENSRKLFTFLNEQDIVNYKDDWNYKDEYLFTIHTYGEDNDWFIYGSGEYVTGFPIDDEMKEFFLENVRVCTGHCGCKNWPRGGSKTFFGKEYKSTCSSDIMFQSPDAKTLDKIEKFVLLIKANIDMRKEDK